METQTQSGTHTPSKVLDGKHVQILGPKKDQVWTHQQSSFHLL